MLRNKPAIGVLCLSLGLLFLSGCNRSPVTEATAAKTGFAPLQLSAEGVDAAEPVTATAPDGNFYVAWVNHDVKNQADVMIGRFDSQGTMRGAPVRVNPQPGVATAWRGDQPSVAVAGNGTVYVVWTARVEADGKKGTDLYLSVSNDMGQTFAAPVKINDDKVPGAHGMHALGIAGDGRIYVSWLDERNVHVPKPSAKAEGHHMESNRELFIAYSTDSGRTFSKNQKIAAEACPCCKTALAVAADGTLYIGWRHVLPGNYRHIAVTSSTDAGATFSAPVIVSDDKWVLQGCPVSGPSLSVDDAGVLKVLWYAAGEANAPGLYFAESKDKGRSFSQGQLLAKETVRGTPVLAAGTGADVAIWETSGGASAETRLRKVANEAPSFTLGWNAELPAAAFSKDGLFVAYVSKVKEKRSVWMVKADQR